MSENVIGMSSEPDNCDVCKIWFVEQGYHFYYQDNKIIKALCNHCNRKDMMDEYCKTKILKTNLVDDNFLYLYHVDMKKDWGFENDDFLKELQTRIGIQLSNKKIQTKIKNFEKEVWFKGLQETVRASSVKGVSARVSNLDNFCVLTYSMCGRTMITIEDDKSSVTLITQEDSKESCMGYRGICATENKAMTLIEMAIQLYNAKHGVRLEFKEDTKVSMGF